MFGIEKQQKTMVIYAFIVVILCTGCSGKKMTDSSSVPINSSNIQSEQENEEESTSSEAVSITNKVPSIPRDEKEYTEKFGTKDQSGKWTPPENSYTDPKTGTIYNEDGVRIGGVEEAPHKARPGSKG